MVLPDTKAPSRCMDCPPGNRPLRSRRSPSATRRATASSRPKCKSAVASVTIGGMTVTGMRRAVAAATSMSVGAIFIEATARRLGLAAMTSPSTRSCSKQNRISWLRTAAQSSSFVRVCRASGFQATSATRRNRSAALGATGCVMNTLGRISASSGRLQQRRRRRRGRRRGCAGLRRERPAPWGCRVRGRGKRGAKYCLRALPPNRPRTEVRR